MCVCVHKGMFVHFLFSEPKLASQFRKACSPCWKWYLSPQIPHFVPVVRIMNINASPCYFSAQIMMMTKPKIARQQKHTQTLIVRTDWPPAQREDVRAKKKKKSKLRGWGRNRFVTKEEKNDTKSTEKCTYIHSSTVLKHLVKGLVLVWWLSALFFNFSITICTFPVQWKPCSPDTLILNNLS